MPEVVIERFHEKLLSVMKEAENLKVTERFQQLEPYIEQAFDLPLMIRIASGGYWKKANDSQKNQLVASFTRMSVSTYASRFSRYSGQAFEFVSVNPGPKKTHLVETRIVSPGHKPVGITYVMRKSGDQWRIIDVLLDNKISELAVRRSEYRRVLRKNGLSGLITILEKKASVLLAD